MIEIRSDLVTLNSSFTASKICEFEWQESWHISLLGERKPKFNRQIFWDIFCSMMVCLFSYHTMHIRINGHLWGNILFHLVVYRIWPLSDCFALVTSRISYHLDYAYLMFILCTRQGFDTTCIPIARQHNKWMPRFNNCTINAFLHSLWYAYSKLHVDT